MSVVLIGIDHRSTSLEALEAFALGPHELAEALELLAKSEHITEAVILSTCLRTEVYVEAVRFHGAVRDAREIFFRRTDAEREVVESSLYELYDDSAFAHLFRVASGLESAVTGEPEVLGQVGRAWEAARQFGTAKGILNGLFRRAIEVGKRARTETAIARGTTSIGQAAVAMAKQKIGELEGKRVLLVGAGEMGDSMATAIADSKNRAQVLVTNRTHERAIDLAERVHGEPVAFEDLGAALADVDLVFTSTGANGAVISSEMVRLAMAGRESRPLVLVDVAMPPDVEITVGAVDDVTVLNMSDLSSFAEAGRLERASEALLVEEIVQLEVQRYGADVTARTVVPVLAALRERMETLRQTELQRQHSKLGALEPEVAALVDQITSTLMNKVLHDPTTRLKAAAGLPEGERMAEALRYLFDV